MTIFDGPQPLKIRGGATPWAVEVEVGGVRVEQALSGLTLRHGYGNRPELHLDLSVVNATEVDYEQVRVVMPAATRDLLIEAGWIPPSGEPAPLRCQLSGQVAEDYATVVRAMSAEWNQGLAPVEAAEHGMDEQEWWHDADHAHHLWPAYVRALVALAVQAGRQGPASIPPIEVATR